MVLTPILWFLLVFEQEACQVMKSCNLPKMQVFSLKQTGKKMPGRVCLPIQCYFYGNAEEKCCLWQVALAFYK
ncbi:hypothetical protein [Pseudodesulfovibrio sp. zrk46]|uniref:hypothetical protein n=1 Tax=Pseudodesulfovibrio sp. zrk46 TaxID=2725288 RepID=UPI001448A52C|nr:hypothetical protein [Pseudodesulfovibrio sp. zrk46]QJB56373.1 hypothetical protein HFN16_08070 [Pseudodesulfovibrio sp. zrk46]